MIVSFLRKTGPVKALPPSRRARAVEGLEGHVAAFVKLESDIAKGPTAAVYKPGPIAALRKKAFIALDQEDAMTKKTSDTDDTSAAESALRKIREASVRMF